LGPPTPPAPRPSIGKADQKMTAPAIKVRGQTSTARCRVTVVRRWRSPFGGTGKAGGSALPSRLGPQVGPQRLAPVGNGGNLLLAQQHLGLLPQSPADGGRQTPTDPHLH